MPDGLFTIAYTTDSDDDKSGADPFVQTYIVDPILNSYAEGVGALNGPQYFSAFNTASRGGLAGSPGHLPDMQRVADLLAELGRTSTTPGFDTRNFFCKSHGYSSRDTIGNGSATVMFTAQCVKDATGNGYDPEIDTTRYPDPYRFVFLLSCGALNNVWAEAFGIVVTDDSPFAYYYHPDGGQVLVSYNSLYGPVPNDASAWSRFSFSLAYFSNRWMNGWPILQIVGNLRRTTTEDAVDLPEPFAGRAGDVDPNAELDIIGCGGLTRTTVIQY